MGWLLRLLLLRLLCAAPVVELSTTLARLSYCLKHRCQVATDQLRACRWSRSRRSTFTMQRVQSCIYMLLQLHPLSSGSCLRRQRNLSSSGMCMLSALVSLICAALQAARHAALALKPGGGALPATVCTAGMRAWAVDRRFGG
jgi:hypothetical protein